MNQQVFDYNKLCQEAQVRWLKPPEILYILQNHERYPITPEVPQKPPSGSLFLFNKRVLRYFRKDGHSWRKKKDGRNVGEAHERLKVGNADALNCYYAHGEQNPYFQRRSYWMLNPAYEHIVLVHYREVSEGRFLYGSNSSFSTNSTSTFNQSTSAGSNHYQGITSRTSEQHDPNGHHCSPGTVEEVTSEFAVGKYDADHLLPINELETSDVSPQPEVTQALRKLAMQLSLEDDDDENTIYFEQKLPAFRSEYDKPQDSAFPSMYEKPQDFGLLDDKTRDSLQESHENLFRGMEYWEHNQIESGKQDDHSNEQLLNVSGDKGLQIIQTLGSGYNVETRNRTPKLSSSSALFNAHGRTAHGRTTNFSTPPGILDSSMLRPSACDQTQNFPFERQEQFAWSQLDHKGNNSECRTTQHLIQQSDLDLQLLATREFLLGPENPTESPTPVSQLGPENHKGANSESRTTQHPIQQSDLDLQLSATREFLLGPENPIESPTPVSHLSKIQIHNAHGTNVYETASDMGKFSKQNSTDWMAAFDLDVSNTFSSDFSAMWFDQGQSDIPLAEDSSLTVAEKQRFSIREISPEWAFSSESTKVIITGDFSCNSSELPLAVMFGSILVPAEIIQEGVLRCMTPQHRDGKVTLCVTSGNRGSCSEVKEFEFRAKPTISNSGSTSFAADATNNEELLLLVRLVHMLLFGSDGLSTLKRGSGTGTEYSRTVKPEAQWSQIIEATLDGSEVPARTIYWIMQELLKDKLQQWLSEYQGKELTKQEQGIIHMISALGYEWALNSVLNSGIGINFRDANGWTALHWAARFGREEMVASLLAAGASAGAVTDPTPQDPLGQTAGAIAAANGHTGLAGYLSEANLTSHLSLLTMGEGEISKGSAEVGAERAVDNISQRSFQLHVGGTEDELSLKDSLAAVRNATQAAAHIQAAFRAHSFRKRHQRTATSEDEYGLTLEDMCGLSASTKCRSVVHGSRDRKFDQAALSIQKKYRGWKGRKDFLTLRQHVVKIQAHVRGYQERKKYKEFVWTVGVLEKVVLRWRRKGVGLRGYRAEPELIDEGDEEVEDIVKVFRKQKVDAAVDQAVSRVLSIVDSPTARQQYRRMLERYHQAKAELGTSDEASSTVMDDFEQVEGNDFTY